MRQGRASAGLRQLPLLGGGEQGPHKLRAGRAPRDGKAPSIPPLPHNQGPQRGRALGAQPALPLLREAGGWRNSSYRGSWGPTVRTGEATRSRQTLRISLLLPSTLEGRGTQIGGVGGADIILIILEL